MLNKLVEHILSEKPEFIGMDNMIEKEILHHDIMSVLHHKGFLQKLTFIGGTSLRLCYDSSRLSEDLDFTGGAAFHKDDFSGLAEELQMFLKKKYNLEVSVREPSIKKTDVSTWKLTIEKHSNRPDLPSQKMHIDVSALPSFDVEHRPIIDHYGIKSNMTGLPVPVQSLKEIMADKMIAFAYRERRIKPRDVWDILWLTQRRAVQDEQLVSKKLSIRNKHQEEFVHLLQKHARQININADTKNDFYQEMSRFLPQGDVQRTIKQKTFWSYVGRIINEEVDLLIRKLIGSPPKHEFDL